MYKKIKPQKTTIKRNESYISEPIERKLERMVNNNEPLSDGAAITYTERQDGVLPELDPRTDRWEHAVEARDKIAKSKLAKREQDHGERTWDTKTPEQQNEFKKKFPNSKMKAPNEIQNPQGGNQGT